MDEIVQRNTKSNTWRMIQSNETINKTLQKKVICSDLSF